MDKLITIKPLDITEVKVSTASPITSRRSKIKKETAIKFSKFNSIKKGAIDEEELLLIKPELNISNLSQYEENLSLDRLLTKLERANRVLKKYGYVNLCISPENVKKLINEIPSVEEELKKEEKVEQPEENTVLPEETPVQEALQQEDPVLEPIPSFDEVTEELEDIPKMIA